MPDSPQRILVTGAAGFIGSHLVDRLLDDGAEVIGIDDLSTGRIANLAAARERHGERLRFEVLDLSDPGVAAVVADTRPMAVAHLAAQISVRDSVAEPVFDARSNIVATIEVLEAAQAHAVGKVVLATSGGCIYGEPGLDQLPVAETAPTEPHSPYGASKLAAETYLGVFEHVHGLDWTSLALANVYGPRQDPFGEAGVVAIFAQRLLAGETCTIYGDGEQTRDFVYVGDVVDAFARALVTPARRRINIGTGVRTSVNRLHAELAALTGHDGPPEHEAPREGELEHIALDIRRAAEVLAWRPGTALADGLAATVDWVRSAPA